MSHESPSPCHDQDRKYLRDGCDKDTAVLQSSVFASPSAEQNTETFGTSNAVIAANISGAFPKTPQRTSPNTCRKRRPIPDLSRPSPGSSHGEKMSMIFRDASATLQRIKAPPCSPVSNSKIPRTPFSQARSVRLGSVHRDEAVTVSRNRAVVHECKTEDSSAVANLDGQAHTRYGPAAAMYVVNDGHKSIDQCRLPSLPDCGFHAYRSEMSCPVEEKLNGDDKGGKEPISSGFATPSAEQSQPAKTPEDIINPDFEHWTLPPSSSPEGSQHGSSNQIIEPSMHAPSSESSNFKTIRSAKINTWLDGIPNETQQVQTSAVVGKISKKDRSSLERRTFSPEAFCNESTDPVASQDRFPKVENAKHVSSGTSSNKENISPSQLIPSPVRSRLQHQTNTPSRFRAVSRVPCPASSAVLRLAHPLMPQTPLSAPPKRKKTRIGGENAKQALPESSRDFTIHDDQLADALAHLSPDVELGRKGRRPKRERCISYWDEDILSSGPPSLPRGTEASGVPTRKGKVVLGESQQTAVLTKEQPFTAGAENKAFDFHI
ncbi:hypothetical protein ACLMJK_009050 [Lecanora helva]